MSNPLTRDLDEILAQTGDLWEEFRGKRIFITGGTGFFGCWLLESLAWANDRLGLKAEAVVLTRNPIAFYQKAPHLAQNSAIHLYRGDVLSFNFPESEFSHVVHAATDVRTQNDQDPLVTLDTIVNGTRRTLDFALHSHAKKFLLTSSGAVYGNQPAELTHISEDYMGGPNPISTGSAYAEGKRAAELLCALYADEFGLETKIARCFALVGPYLPLDAHFAIGNFIRDALQQKAILVKGDGTPYRSYLYVSDLAVWLWTILCRGKSCYPYNVGSESAISIGALARLIATSFHPGVDVEITGRADTGKAGQRYVPSTLRAQLDLGLKQMVDLPSAIRLTARWHNLISSDK